MATMPAQFLSCDWGTSSFRLRLVSTATNEILAEIESKDGVKSSLAQNWPEWSRPDWFADIVRNKIEGLAQKHAFNSLPLVISGMASSTIGWKPLPYAKLPMPIDGSGFHIEELEWEAPRSVTRTLLISGAASDDDIMRGEECQIVGLLAKNQFAALADNVVIVLPGTHSKHVFVQNRNIVRFRTFMTGELFELLSKYSILSASMPSADPPRPRRSGSVSVSSEHSTGFIAGVNYVRKHGLMKSLFQVRTRSVLDGIDGWENRGFLSGLLVGAEVVELAQDFEHPIIVAGPLADEYTMAFSLFGKSVELQADVDRATTNGHHVTLAHFYS
jgi:2-dehydro-3-deoxygalactonokinase